MHAARNIGLLCLGSFLFLSACTGKDGGSEQKTLDNLARGEVKTDNQCRGDSALPKKLEALWESRINFGTDVKATLDSDTQKKYRAAVKEYLSAVPAEVQLAFLDFGGEILLTGKANERCTQAFKQTGTQYLEKDLGKVDSCLIFAKESDSSVKAGSSVLAIYHQIDLQKVGAGLDKNQSAISHGGVRAFGFAFAQFFAHLAPNDKVNPARPQEKYILTTTDTFAMASIKENLANRFLVDMALSKTFQLEAIEPLIGSGGAAVVRKYLLRDDSKVVKAGLSVENAKILDQLSFLKNGETSIAPQEKQIRAQRFKDFVFAESFDSKNCSSSSRAVMEKEFSATNKLFDSVQKVVVDTAKQIYVQSEREDIRTALQENAPVSRSRSFSLDGTYAYAPATYTSSGALGGILQQLFGMFSSSQALGVPARANPVLPPINTTPSLTDDALAGTQGGSGAGTCPGCSGCQGDGCSGCPNCKVAGSGTGQVSGCNCSNGTCSGCSGGCCNGNCG